MAKVLLFNSVTPFTPPTANLAANYDARLGVTLSGSNVSRWADQSGNSRDLTPPVTGPTFSGSGTTSRLIFNGFSQYLKSASFTLLQPVTVYIVMTQASWANSRAIFDGNTTASMDMLQNSGPPALWMNAGSLVVHTSDLLVGSAGVVTTVWNGSSSSISVNDGTKSTGNVGAGNPNGFTLGNAGGGGGFWSNIEVREVYIYSTNHNAALQTSMIAYLRSKWAI